MASLMRAKVNKKSKKKDGLFYIRLWLPHTKKIKTIATGTDNEKKAKKILSEIEFAEKMRKCKEHSFVAIYEDFMKEKGWDDEEFNMKKEPIRIEKAIDMYLDSKENYVTKSTVYSYKVALKDFKNAFSKKTLLMELNVRDYDTLFNFLNSNYGKGTTNIRLRGIRTFLNWAVDNEYIEKPPFKRFIFNKIYKPVRRMRDEEVLEIFAKVNDPIILSIFRVHLNTGLRLSELLSSKLYHNDNGYFLEAWDLKGKHIKKMPLPESILEDYQISIAAEYGTCRVSKAFTKAKRDSEVEGEFTFHSLRHTYACRMLEKTQDLCRVSKWLGHSSTKVTEDNYLTELDEGYQLSLSKSI
ncbi:MAG: tyrosine-type recombinase/integrase [Candidatus Marinimicrobia bacterium]|nr:tyrosine-type recombinase/integrase [Candidatus Neomarinimicrobiota bacterium]